MEEYYLTRKLEDVVLDAARYFSVITITGPRQSGKTTLLKHLFPKAKRFSMKDLDVKSFAYKDPVAFLNQDDGNGIFIDEVQKLPLLLEYIQGIVDEHPERKFYLTGRVPVFQPSPVNSIEDN